MRHHMEWKLIDVITLERGRRRLISSPEYYSLCITDAAAVAVTVVDCI